VCRKNKKASEFAADGKSPRCKECKNKSEKKKKAGQDYFGI
jgi:hypothetical protein